jgi:Predicted pPIWI-associating nuclease
MNHIALKLSNKSTKWISGLQKKLSDAVLDYDLSSKDSWAELQGLSAKTEFDGIEVDANASVVNGDELIAPATVYVKLNYGSGKDGTTFNDSYPARVFFVTDTKTESVSVKRIEVDVSSFYE